jgi:16S rRNA processing protein RimM
MIRATDCYEIGRIGKAHGVHGEVTFLFTDDVFDRADADYLVLEVDGILVPFFMEEYRFRSDSLALVKFVGIDTQERASELTHSKVWFPRALTPTDEEEAPSLASLVGFDLVEATSNTVVGRIASIDDTTANVLYELENGLLVPAHDELVEAIDMAKKTIIMHIPEGLLEL